MTTRVLVVDDEPQICRILNDKLVSEGYEVYTAGDGEMALNVFRDVRPDLIVLDLMLPKLDGFEVLRRIRSQSDVPIIILSVKGDEIDKVLGFRMGIDDYMTKPFSPSELSLRIEAILRRSRSTGAERRSPSKNPIVVGNLYIDRERRIARCNDQELELTAREFDLLWFLASHRGIVFTRDQLLEQVWGHNYVEDRKNVTVLVSRLREKIESDPSNPRFIKTVWGVGYKFVG